MKNFIYYPGLDPVDLSDLKTFISQERDIIFFFHNSKHQHWNFTNKYKRDQAHAFLLDQYTDRPSGLLLKEVMKYESKPFVSAKISEFEIILYREKNNLQNAFTLRFRPETNNLEFHLFILDIINDPDLKQTWERETNMPALPYPLNPNPLNLIL